MRSDTDSIFKAFSKLSKCKKTGFYDGGEQFSIIVNNSAGQTAENNIRHIQKAVADNRLLSELNISCSIAGADCQKEDDFVSLFERVATALYLTVQKDKKHSEVSVA